MELFSLVTDVGIASSNELAFFFIKSLIQETLN